MGTVGGETIYTLGGGWSMGAVGGETQWGLCGQSLDEQWLVLSMHIIAFERLSRRGSSLFGASTFFIASAPKFIAPRGWGWVAHGDQTLILLALNRRAGGTMADLLKGNRALPLDEARFYFGCIVSKVA